MIHSIASAGLLRQYLVHEPPKASLTQSLPLFLFLHGAGGTAAWSLEETGLHHFADREGFLLVLPDATRKDPTRPPGFLNNPQVWNDGAGRQSEANDVAFIDSLLEAVLQDYPVDATRIYVAGFSNGAGMTFRLGAELSHWFAALAPVAGHCAISNPEPTRPPSTLYLIGDQDPLIPLEGGPVRSPWTGDLVLKPPVRQTLDRWALAMGCSLPPRSLRGEDGIQEIVYENGFDQAELRAVTIAGLGHHWPGGRGQLSRRLAGNPSSRFHANEAIWGFCRGRRLK